MRVRGVADDGCASGGPRQHRGRFLEYFEVATGFVVGSVGGAHRGLRRQGRALAVVDAGRDPDGVGLAYGEHRADDRRSRVRGQAAAEEDALLDGGGVLALGLPSFTSRRSGPLREPMRKSASPSESKSRKATTLSSSPMFSDAGHQALVPVHKAVVGNNSVHECCRLLVDPPMVAVIGPSDRRLDGTGVENSGGAAILEGFLMRANGVREGDSAVLPGDSPAPSWPYAAVPKPP